MTGGFKMKNWAMTYERFIRKAFKANVKGGDPAGLGAADTFETGQDDNEFDLAEIKTGACYAMAIFNKDILDEQHELSKQEELNTKCERMLVDLMNAENKQSVYEIIVKYNKDILGIEE